MIKRMRRAGRARTGEVMVITGCWGFPARCAHAGGWRPAGLRIEGLSYPGGMELSEYLSHGVSSNHSLTTRPLHRSEQGVSVQGRPRH